MKRTILLSLAALAACAGPGVSPGPGRTAPSAAPVASSGSFLLVRGTETIASERFTRTPARLDGALSLGNGSHFSYTADLAADASVRRIEIRVFPVGTPAEAPPAQRSVAVFQGDSVELEGIRGDSTRRSRVGTSVGAVAYINPSPSLMEQIIRRARAMGGESVQVPVFVASSSPTTVPASVRFAADSAVLSIANTELRLRVDAAGRLLGGSVPAQGLVIERREGTP